MFFIYIKKPLAPRHCDGLLLFFFMTSDLTCASAVLIVLLLGIYSHIVKIFFLFSFIFIFHQPIPSKIQYLCVGLFLLHLTSLIYKYTIRWCFYTRQSIYKYIEILPKHKIVKLRWVFIHVFGIGG